jgi:hypothetical protein
VLKGERRMKQRRLALILLLAFFIAASLLIAVPVKALPPTEVWVDDDYNPLTPGWGTDHFASVQNGIDAVAVGGTVNVAAGTYQENLAAWKDMEIIKSLSLIGSGSGTTVIQLSEGNGLGGKMNGVEIRGSNLDVHLEGLNFTKRHGNTYATTFPLRIAETASSFTKLTMIDVEVAYAEASDVILGGNGVFNEVYIENCYFHHAGTWGFLGSGTINKITVINSDFEYNGQVDPGHGVGFDLTGPSSTNVLVDGGSFSNNKQAGINLMRVSNAVFRNLVANDNSGASGGGFGIKLDEWGGKSEDILIEKCIASGNGLDGITISPEKEDAIENVTILCSQLTGNGRDGLNLVYIYSGSNNPQMTDVSITCSQIFGNGGFGVQVWSWWVYMPITEVFNAENNWWGSASGPYHSTLNPSGTGDKVSDNVDFTPWATWTPPCGPPPVGGEWVPVNAIQMLVQLVSSIVATSAIVASFVGFKRIKKRQN